MRLKFLPILLVIFSTLAHADVKQMLKVHESDGSPSANNVTDVAVSNGSLTDNGGGKVTINTGGGGAEFDPLSIHLDQDIPQTIINGFPTFDSGWVSNANTIQYGNSLVYLDAADAYTIRSTSLSSNYSQFGIGLNVAGGYAYIQSKKHDSGTELPLTFWSNAAERMRINTDGTIKFNAYTSGFLKTDAVGLIGLDTSTYLTTAVTSIKKTGESALTGAVTLSQGTNITLTQSGNDISIASSGGFTSPMTTLGDTIYENATPTADRVAGNTTTTKKFYRQTGTGSVSAAPAWDTVLQADVTGLKVTDGPTFSGLTVQNQSTTGASSVTISNGNIQFAEIAAPSAPTAALAGVGAGNLSSGAYKYKVCLQNVISFTAGSTASNTVTVTNPASNGKINITGLPTTAPSPLYGIAIYRTVANGSVYYKLYQVGNFPSSYLDNISDATLVGNDEYNPYGSTAGGISIGGSPLIRLLSDPDTGNALFSLFVNAKYYQSGSYFVLRSNVMDEGYIEQPNTWSAWYFKQGTNYPFYAKDGYVNLWNPDPVGDLHSYNLGVTGTGNFSGALSALSVTATNDVGGATGTFSGSVGIGENTTPTAKLDVIVPGTCSGDPTGTCSSYSTQTPCLANQCTWSATGDCSAYNGNQSTCETAGCTYEYPSCESFDEANCNPAGCTKNYTSCSGIDEYTCINSPPTGCGGPQYANACTGLGQGTCASTGCTENWIDPMNCSCGDPYTCACNNAYCDAGGCGDQGSCESASECNGYSPSTWHPDTMNCSCGDPYTCSCGLTQYVDCGGYVQGAYTGCAGQYWWHCSGNYYTGNCVGNFYACSGTPGACSALTSGATCLAEDGCDWATGLGIYTTGNIKTSALSGSGNGFICVDTDGKLYRSATACA